MKTRAEVTLAISTSLRTTSAPCSPSTRLTKNNFDLLRLLFAGVVCLVHAYELSGFHQLSAIASMLSSAIAVKAFFVVSGFLIFMSYERSASLGSYASKRIRRIYPAYFVVIVLCAFGLLIVSSKIPVDFFSTSWIRYLVANLAFLNFIQPTLPGVFEANKLAAVNGALWTLKIEVMFYLTVPLIVLMFRRFSHFPVLVFLYGASVTYSWLMSMLAERSGSGLYIELGRQLPGQLSYFIAGAFFYYFLHIFERKAAYFISFAIALLLAGKFIPLAVFDPFILATIVTFLALVPYLGNFGKYGDFSYGVYILHFPIIQILLHTTWFSNEEAWLFLVCVIVITLGFGILMWHLVEKQFLYRNSHYIASSATETPIAKP